MERVKIKDICRLINGRAYKQEELLDSGKYPVLRVGNFFSDKDFYYSDLELEEDKYCDNGDLLFAWSASFGPKIWDGEKVIYHYHIWKMELTDRVNKEFLFYYLFHLSERIKSEGHGGIMIHTTKAEMEEREFNLPTHEEQIAISEILNKVKSVIDKRKEELSALDDLIKARFVEMFGTPYRNEKGFLMLTVDDVIEFTGGAQPDKKYFEYEPTEDNIRLIQIRDYKTDNYITYIPKKMAKRFCDADDIMIGRYGPPIFQILQGIEGSYNVALMKATPKMGNREFIRYFLKQDCLFSYLDGLSQRTAGQSGIEMPALKAYPFPYPPIELQNQFADFVTQVNKSKVAVQKALDEAQLLFDSLMQQYFG